MNSQLHTDLPNIPKDIINQWLLPFANDIGWPPTADRWQGILKETDISYWKTTKWSLEKIHTSSFIKNTPSNSTLTALYEAYFLGITNEITESLGERSKERCHVQLHQLINHGKFREPLILFNYGKGNEVVDGNHRLASYIAWKHFKTSEAFIAKLSTTPKELYQFQYAWVGKNA